MNKFLELNKPRGERIAALVDMIERSAKSQKAPDAELAEVMAPAIAAMRVHMVAPDEIPLPQDTRGQQLSAEAREPARAHVAAKAGPPTNPVAVSHWVHQASPEVFRAIVAATIARLNDGESG